jgi:hypothetical protein
MPLFETSNHCFIFKNKEHDMTGIVPLKVESLKLHFYIVYYNFSSLRTSLFYKLSMSRMCNRIHHTLKQSLEKKIIRVFILPVQSVPITTKFESSNPVNQQTTKLSNIILKFHNKTIYGQWTSKSTWSHN